MKAVRVLCINTLAPHLLCDPLMLGEQAFSQWTGHCVEAPMYHFRCNSMLAVRGKPTPEVHRMELGATSHGCHSDSEIPSSWYCLSWF